MNNVIVKQEEVTEYSFNDIELLKQIYKYQNSFATKEIDETHGGLIGIIGGFGSGKSVYASITAPFERTMYFGCETAQHNKLTQALKDAGLIGYAQVDLTLGMNILSVILNRVDYQIQERVKRNLPKLKVVIIDSFQGLTETMMVKDREATDNFRDINKIWHGKPQAAFTSFINELLQRNLYVIFLNGVSRVVKHKDNAMQEYSLIHEINQAREWFIGKIPDIYHVSTNPIFTDKDSITELIKENSGRFLEENDRMVSFLQRLKIIVKNKPNAITNTLDNLINGEIHGGIFDLIRRDIKQKSIYKDHMNYIKGITEIVKTK